MEESSSVIHVTVRRFSGARAFRLWAEVDGNFGVTLAQSRTMAGLRRTATRAIRRQWELRSLGGMGAQHPEIRWHRSSRRYARLAGREVVEIRSRIRESNQTVRRIERTLRRAGAYSREARYIALGQVYLAVDFERSKRTGRLEVAPWNP